MKWGIAEMPFLQICTIFYLLFIEPTKEVMAAMKKFGYSSFRGGQEDAVMRILCGKSIFNISTIWSGPTRPNV